MKASSWRWTAAAVILVAGCASSPTLGPTGFRALGKTPTPCPTPTCVEPTPCPSPTPCPTPTPVCDTCKVTGGGFITYNDIKYTFGYEAQTNPNGVKGNIEVNEHGGANRQFHSNDVTTISCDNPCVTFGGTLTDGGTFTATVCDYGEPGRADTFSFTVLSGPQAGFSISGVQEQGGNVQYHPTH